MNKTEVSWLDEAEHRAEHSDDVEYQSWFDTTTSVCKTIANGQIDFFHRILTPRLYQYLGDPGNKSCIEIGFGGGRLLCAASSVFKWAYGVDILGPKGRSRTEKFLSNSGRNNFTLLHRDEALEKLPKDIGFAYSFIVMQHLSGVDQIDFYLNMLDHILAPDGCGIIFFGKHPQGKDFEAIQLENARACTLFVSPKFIQDKFSQKFDVIDIQEAGLKKIWDTNSGVSGQFWISFKRKKNDNE